MLSRLKEENPESSDSINLSKLIMYTSKLGHSCIEKAAMIGMVQIRQLETDENFSLRGNVLESAIKEDRKKGLVPFFVSDL
jgi:glutamate/tyrosine decarboxylase-like PLP-dependent enzyme